MILTEIGEIGVHHNGTTYILRPSFYAMSQIGSPVEIIRTYAVIMNEYHDPRQRWRQFLEALSVVKLCCDEDVSDIFGYVNDNRKYVKKAADISDVLALARALMRHGVTGVQEPLKRKEENAGDFVSEFKFKDHVAMAMAHIGVSEKEAWEMTMTSLVAAMRAKFPEPESNEPGSKSPTKEQHEATMEWFEKIQRKRGQKVH